MARNPGASAPDPGPLGSTDPPALLSGQLTDHTSTTAFDWIPPLTELGENRCLPPVFGAGAPGEDAGNTRSA